MGSTQHHAGEGCLLSTMATNSSAERQCAGITRMGLYIAVNCASPASFMKIHKTTTACLFSQADGALPLAALNAMNLCRF